MFEGSSPFSNPSIAEINHKMLLLLALVTSSFAGRIDPQTSLGAKLSASSRVGSSRAPGSDVEYYTYDEMEKQFPFENGDDVNSGPGKGPLIGILAQPCESCPSRMYINAAYAKKIQLAGGRAVPIRYYDNKEELWRIFKSINGMIWPGGLTWLYQDEPYLWTARQLFRWAVEENDKGDVFPIWGTCLGFQLLHMLMGDVYRDELLVPTDSVDHATTLNVTEAGRRSKLLGTLDPKLLQMVQDPAFNITMENHEYGILPRRYLDYPDLAKALDILTTTKDRNGVEYVSTVEAKKYPFFGSQWHPEKPPFEFNLGATPHSFEAIRLSQHVANIFVGFARMSQHKPRSNDELKAMLLDRHAPISIYDDASIQTTDNYDGPELSHYIDPWELPPPKTADPAKMAPHNAQLCRADLDAPYLPCKDKKEKHKKDGQKKGRPHKLDAHFKASTEEDPKGTAAFLKEML